MCSIGEDDFGDDGGVHSMIPEKSGIKSETNGHCKKCQKSNIEVFKIFFRDFECEECFLATSRHKFRATLGSSKVLPRDANVLLYFDGSGAAEVLLDMAYYAQTQNNFKRLHCTVKIIYFDESPLQHEKNGGGMSLFKLQEQLKKYPAFESYVTPISDCDSLEIENLQALESCMWSNHIIHDLNKKLSNIKSLTSRQDWLKYKKMQLIGKVAQHLNCPFVFLPDISETLATQLLTAVALGRGESAAYDVSLVDDRLEHNIKIIRPLRDLTQPEIDLYVIVRDLKPLKTGKDIDTILCNSPGSLQNLTSSFVKSLQGNYSSTVSTVFRCCDKIAPKTCLSREMSSLAISEENLRTIKRCTLCCSPLTVDHSRTLLAIEFSRIVSEKGAKTEDCLELDNLAKKNLATQNEGNFLCHACHNIAKDQNQNGPSTFSPSER